MVTMLENSYAKLPERFYERIHPEQFKDPSLVLFNDELANELGLKFLNETEMAQVFSGQQLMPGSEPIALAYAGAQFGHFVPQLGDGRAHLLGEVKGLDIQLKGSGRTRFSRRGDGRSSLGPVIREFLVSEAMYALGIPTTRSLSVVTTGETVFRQDGPEPGAILTRVAESHLRVGTFQYFANLGDQEALEILTDYAIRRHYQEIQSDSLPNRYLEFLKAFAERQIELIAKWYAAGFIHGVMNTDNCSIAGITIDYGPCAFLDEFRNQKVFSSIDTHGRYAYGNQMAIAEWNILRLAECLLPIIDCKPDTASTMVKETLEDTLSSFPRRIFQVFARKLGFAGLNDGINALIIQFLRYLETNSLDYTVSFSNLDSLYSGETRLYSMNAELTDFLKRWKALGPDLSLLNSSNPKLIPRNHQIQQVIDHANQRDYAPLKEMWEALKSPFDVSEKHTHMTLPPKPNERVYQTFCGT